MKKKNILRLAASLCALALGACSAEKNSTPLRSQNSDDFEFQRYEQSYESLISALKLSHDPALPSELLQDDSYREKLKQDFVENAKSAGCSDIAVKKSKRMSDGRSIVLLEMTQKDNVTKQYATLQLPQTHSAPKPLVVYVNSQTENPYNGAEASSLLGNIEAVVLTPLLSNQSVDIGGEIFEQELRSNAFLSEAVAVYSFSLCIQNHAVFLDLPNGRYLNEHLLPSSNEFGGFRTIIAGSGTGALIATIVSAHSGAMLLASETDSTVFAHFDCAVHVNPLYSLYAAESRLMLAALVHGYTEETKYKNIPGIKELRYSFFRPFRNKELDKDSLAFEIAKRDALILAPFLHLSLKDFSKSPNEKGAEAGALLVLQDTINKAYTANGSRIFANVFSSISFKLADITNGAHFLYREFESPATRNTSFESPILSSQALVGREISNLFVRPPEFVSRHDEYRWIIRGRAFEDSTNKTPQETLENFFRTSCN